jgi:hypothetical protein
VLRLLARRAGVQLPLLAAVLAVVVIGATLLGVCALLLTASSERALDEGVARATPDDVDVTAYVTDVKGENARSVAEEARTAVTSTLDPFRTTSAARASSVMRTFGGKSGALRLAYLSSVDGLASRAKLITGRWPQPSAQAGPLEAVILEPTARLLGLAPGGTFHLGAEVGPDEGGPVTVRVVGIFRPLPESGWDRDPLGGAGYNPAYTDGRFPLASRAYGPFVVDMSDLFASGSTLNRLQVTAHPDLSSPTSATLNVVANSLAGADNRLARTLGDRVRVERIASELPVTLAEARSQQAVTGSTVLVVALLGTVLTAAALGLAGRLVASLRSSETALLSALGASRGQLAAAAVAESVALAALAAVLAVPLSGLAHAGLTHLPPLADAGLAARPGATGAQVAAVVVGAIVLAAVLVVPALRPDPAQIVAVRGRLGLLARSGADLGLIGLAVAGWWQLRAQPAAGTGTGTDVVRVLAPALCLLAGAAVALRLVSPPLRVAERLARRSRALVLPLAAFEAARRPQAVAAALLLALAAAAATFGLAFGATWERSQHDQADVRVGTDLALALSAPVATGQGDSVAAATGGVVSPVTHRGVAVGQWLGGAGAAPRLVAVDTSRAGTLLRGRLPDGQTWTRVGAALAPHTRVTGLALPAGSDPVVTLTGTSTPGALRAAPRLVLQDRQGLRTVCTAPPVSLDGQPHPVQLCGPFTQGLSLVAVAFQVDLDLAAEGPVPDSDQSHISVALSLPAAAASGSGITRVWTANSAGDTPELVTGAAARVTSTSAVTIVRTTATVELGGLYFNPVEVVATAFRPPAAVPVAVSRQLSDALRAPVGARLNVTVGTTLVPVVVSAVVPTIPSAPDAVAMLADVNALSMALIVTGNLEPPVDAWWVGAPTEPAAGDRAAALGLGDVVTRANVTKQLIEGPLRVGLPAALAVLVPAALLLVLAGTVMHVTSDLEARALEVARLRGLGLSRRDVIGGLLAQHGGVLVLLLVAGALVGALASRAVGPLLIRSDLGARPVPAALARWPWPAEGVLLAVLLIGCTAAVALVVVVQVRRADAAHLRVGA